MCVWIGTLGRSQHVRARKPSQCIDACNAPGSKELRRQFGGGDLSGPAQVAASLHQTAGVRSFVVEHSRRPWSHRAGDLGWRGPHQDCPRQRSHHHGLRSRVRVRVRAQPPGEDGEPQAPPTADSPAPSADSSSSSSNGQDPASEHQPEETKKPSKLSVLALTMAATWAKTNASFLQFRKRKTWWKRGEYPKVRARTCRADLQEYRAAETVESWRLDIQTLFPWVL